LTAYSPLLWSKTISRLLQKQTVFRSVASFSEQAGLKYGLSVDRPYRTELVAENYTKLTALTAQDVASTSEKLEINKQKAIFFKVDDIDKIQNLHDTVAIYSKDAAKTLAVAQDAEFLYEAAINATSVVDAGDLGGTAGTGITLTTSNVDSVFGEANRELDVQNVDRMDRFAAISPQFIQVLWERVAGKESIFGDKTGEFANMGTYAGFSLYQTNNLTASARWTPANQPTDGATITINGVVFNLVTTLGSTAGNVLIEVDTATTLDNIVAAINAGGAGVASKAVAHSAANQRTMQQWVAVDGTTYFEVRAKGASYMTLATSEAADVWSVPTQHNVFGKKGATDMVVQKDITVDTDKLISGGVFGVGIGLLTVFGVKNFATGAKELVDVKIDTTSF